jgi:tripartite-type tricarboxylate transporter receptor subunit TctC
VGVGEGFAHVTGLRFALSVFTGQAMSVWLGEFSKGGKRMLNYLRKLNRPMLMAAVGAIAGLSVAATPSQADDFPTKPIQINVPFGANSSTNVATQALIPFYQEELGVSLVPNYTSGGGGTIGTAWMVSQRPDGYVLGMVPAGPVLPKPILQDLPYDVGDLAPVGHVGTFFTALVVPKDSPWQTFDDFLEAAKASDGSITYATSGENSVAHLTMKGISDQAGFKIRHVPMGGSGNVIAALHGKQVQLAGTEVRGDLGADGKTRLLVVDNAERLEKFPDVPTFSEVGFSGLSPWYAVYAPVGVPEERMETLENALEKVVKNPEFQERMGAIGVSVQWMSREDTQARVDREFEMYSKLLGASE